MSAFTSDQIMFSLAWIAFAGDLLADGPASNADDLRREVVARLGGIEPVKDRWDLVWGPASFKFDGVIFDNGMAYVVRERRGPGEQARFVVAIRGTNPISLSSWLVEDFDVGTTVRWPYGEPPDSLHPEISSGTRTALSGLEGLRSEGRSLLEFLREEVATLPGAAVTLTGHSLGGLLASTLALALVDRRVEWDEAERVAIDVYSFAAPTAGNSDFASYTDLRLGNALHRIWNTHDLAPRAWDLALLQDLDKHYAHDVWWLAGFGVFLLAAQLALAGRRYVQPSGNGEPLPGKPAPVPGFLIEAIHQHGQAYIDLLGLTPWLDQFDVVQLRSHGELRLAERACRSREDRASGAVSSRR